MQRGGCDAAVYSGLSTVNGHNELDLRPLALNPPAELHRAVSQQTRAASRGNIPAVHRMLTLHMLISSHITHALETPRVVPRLEWAR